jgi:hypothetical protein
VRSFRLGVSFRHRPGAFDSSGDCGHIKSSESEQGKTQLGCSVDCDGGGITVELVRDDKSTLVRLDSIRIWRNNKPDEAAPTTACSASTAQVSTNAGRW